ncbi:archease family protein [Methanothermus fervidus DSM 2088]|uniref:Protein archease n=1 Tax=Methanothermus fervidus (strain ATCC 43054 / DSM 2088 / JCM 10308 / V24 S) TaxID=523846 RepID=E3GYA7_METFV|nr:archease [Methanothermus fervidus]ADP77289.1 archease family protein [Methanothermus fervidus DSM 2088]
MKFEFIDVTADAGFHAYGSTLEELFENAALALFEIITDTSKVKDKECRKIEIESEDKISLLHDWLEELLVTHEIEMMLFSKFKVEISDCKLRGMAWGEKINPDIHEIKCEVKAITYHLMNITKENDKYKATVIVDI